MDNLISRHFVVVSYSIISPHKSHYAPHFTTTIYPIAIRVFTETRDYIRVKLVATIHRTIGRFVKSNTEYFLSRSKEPVEINLKRTFPGVLVKRNEESVECQLQPKLNSECRTCSSERGKIVGTVPLKCDGTRAETRFSLSAKRTSPFTSAGGGSVQSNTGSRGVRISGSNAGYTMFRGSVKSTGYPLHSPVSPPLPFPCVTVYHYISTGV